MTRIMNKDRHSIVRREEDMCHQFQWPSWPQVQKTLTDLKLPVDFAAFDPSPWQAGQDVWPDHLVPVLLYQDHRLQLQVKHWGYKNPFEPQKVLVNARVERFYEKQPSLWDDSFARQRCLILADSFIEISPKRYPGKNGKNYHERVALTRNDEPVLFIAGIYDQDRFAMVTTQSNETMMPIHSRMPLVLTTAELRRWLFKNFTSLIDRQGLKLTPTILPHQY